MRDASLTLCRTGLGHTAKDVNLIQRWAQAALCNDNFATSITLCVFLRALADLTPAFRCPAPCWHATLKGWLSSMHEPFC